MFCFCSLSFVWPIAESTYAKDGLLSTSDGMDNLLRMRRNMVEYVQFIDTFAPCVVGCSVWKDRFRVANACSSGNAEAFQELVSVSDEAFILAVFVNFVDRWSAEILRDRKQVSKCKAVNVILIKRIFTFHILFCHIDKKNVDRGR